LGATKQNDLSLIIPAFQEEKRIGDSLVAITQYLDAHYPGAELIVVCDGCRDRTAEVARSILAKTLCRSQVIELATNQGKGAAVRAGMMAASSDFRMFTDADLSYSPDLIPQFLDKLQDGADVVIAQREKKTKYESLKRRVLAQLSRALVGNFLLPGIRDTQAGLKGFTRSAAEYLFPRLRTTRFLFDLEALMIARRKGLRIEKIYVDWVDRKGSTVQVGLDTARSIRDLSLICFWNLIGAYDKPAK
jgi:glycosyltransferase involved in cell wall biosynthesis